MPIRFRCPFCNQLMGIARRKAGTTVSCTACRSQVVVPTEDSPDPRPTAPARDVFDRDDFDIILHREPVARGAVAAPLAPPPPPAREQPLDESFRMPAPPAPPPGIVLSPGWVTMLTVVLILLLALAFVGGVLVGRFAL